MDLEHGHTDEEIAARIAAPARQSFVKDTVYGGIDGAITTFAIVAGVAGAGLSTHVIIALGLANVLADGFSMAASNYSGTKAERDDIRRLRAMERRHIELHPEGERAELRAILAAKGLEGDVLEAATDAITANHKIWIDTMMEGEYGLSSTDPHPLRAGLVTFAAFLAAGVVPLVPFIVGIDDAFSLSAVMTGVVFFAIGAFKARWSLTSWWRSGLETLLIGGVAASIAFFVGSLFEA